VLKAARSVRVVSQILKREVETLGVRAPIVVLPIFVDISKFKEIVHERHPAFQHTIVWLGRFEAEKDPLKAIAILADVRRELPDTGLVMLGSGTVEPLLKARVHKLGLTGWVDFPGWQPPANYFAQADVVVCTSQFEGFGASIIEALAAGVPVVAPDVGVAREAGATVVAREQLAKAVFEALTRPQKGVLALPLHSAEEWAAAWAASLAG
jgi:glycosyltransferase involved in cell wall biosynthesis